MFNPDSVRGRTATSLSTVITAYNLAILFLYFEYGNV